MRRRTSVFHQAMTRKVSSIFDARRFVKPCESHPIQGRSSVRGAIPRGGTAMANRPHGLCEMESAATMTRSLPTAALVLWPIFLLTLLILLVTLP
jgi:hypothetical protein